MGKWVLMCVMKTASVVEKKFLSSYLDVLSKNVNNRILLMFDYVCSAVCADCFLDILYVDRVSCLLLKFEFALLGIQNMFGRG